MESGPYAINIVRGFGAGVTFGAVLEPPDGESRGRLGIEILPIAVLRVEAGTALHHSADARDRAVRSELLFHDHGPGRENIELARNRVVGQRVGVNVNAC